MRSSMRKDLYANKTKVWLYVDWSPELNGDTSESRRASEFEFYRAYREGAWLLRETGDTANAEKYERRAAAIKIAADKYLLDPATGDLRAALADQCNGRAEWGCRPRAV